MNKELLLTPNKLVAYLGKPCKEFTKADIIRFIEDALLVAMGIQKAVHSGQQLGSLFTHFDNFHISYLR